MGQQQLLLLVLATVIVGLATVAGIQAFEQGQTRAEQDALTSTAVKVASDIQARIKEPTQFGGYDGDISEANGSITLTELGYKTNGDGTNAYETSEGECAITTGGSSSGSPENGSAASTASTSGDDIAVTCASPDNNVTAVVSGTNPDDIVTFAETSGS